MARVIGKATLNRRRDLRRERQFPATLDGEAVGVMDISLGGAHLYAPETTFGEEAGGVVPEQALRLAIPDESGNELTFDVEVVRIQPEEKGISVRFIGLTDLQFRLLERIITHGLPQYKDWQTGPDAAEGTTDQPDGDDTG